MCVNAEQPIGAMGGLSNRGLKRPPFKPGLEKSPFEIPFRHFETEENVNRAYLRTHLLAVICHEQ